MADTFAESNLGAIARWLEKRQEPRTIDVKDPATGNIVPVLLTPDGTGKMSHWPLELLVSPWRDRPRRRSGTATLTDLESFIAHVKRHQDPQSVLFADPSKPSITAVLDYNEAGPSSSSKDGSETGKPRFGAHRAVYSFPVSPEWTAWTKQDGEPMGQAEFAAFLEDRIQDVTDPPAMDTGGAYAPSDADKRLLDAVKRVGGRFGGPERLLELSRGLSVKATHHVDEAVTLESGEMQISFEEKHTDKTGNKLNVPSMFVIAIPVFDAGPLYRIPARLRYRLAGGAVKWFYQLWHHERARDDHYREQCQKAATDTGLPLFYGVDEGKAS